MFTKLSSVIKVMSFKFELIDLLFCEYSFRDNLYIFCVFCIFDELFRPSIGHKITRMIRCISLIKTKLEI